MLLRHAVQIGWDAVGVEPSPSLSKLAIERLGLTVYNCFLHELPESKLEPFHVIALNDVFEHICDPLPFLRDVARFLADDGIVYVKVANGRWNLFKQKMLGLMGRKAKQGVWDSYEHVAHYTDATLTRMVERVGFPVVRLAIGKPIRGPIWHEYVAHYYQYPSPWFLDWKRHVGRSAFYWLSWPERLFRGGSIGKFAPNFVALAKRR